MRCDGNLKIIWESDSTLQKHSSVALTAQQSVDGESTASANEQSHRHQKKRQAVFDPTALSRTARQEESILPVSLLHCHPHEDRQPQRKRPREKPDQQGEASQEFGKHSNHANGHRNSVLVLPVIEHAFHSASAEPTENLLCRVKEERDRQAQA